MSGVRNLRAMFEQKGENNPPDRGRSPGPGGLSVGSPSPSHSPRPLSKVRTTFVAIEKDGRVGLRREHSGDSVSVSSRRFSNETEATTPQPAPEKTDIFAENMAKNATAFKTNLSQEAIPESPKLVTVSKPSPKKDHRSPNLVPNSNPDKVTDEEETRTRLLPGNPTEKAATRGNSVTPTGGISSPATNSKPKTTAVTKPLPRAGPNPTLKPLSKAPKSPNTIKQANSTTKGATNAPSLAPQKKAAHTSSNDHDGPKKTTALATKASVTSGKKPGPIDLPPSGTGFVKPKPKSPTRPVKLPASLMAPTAAYASKLGSGNAAHPPRQSLSRASGNAQHLNVGSTLHRSPSRASISTVGTVSNTKSLKRQSSTISRPRPSLGPPPKPLARDHPVAKRESHVDEGFLARMMRPTQSSSSKTSGKAPLTPPRKQSAPSTSHKKPITKDIEGSAKKVAAKIQSSTNKPKAAAQSIKQADKEAPATMEIAPVVAQTETAEAAIEADKVSTDTATLPVIEKTEEFIEPATAEMKDENNTNAVESLSEPGPEPVSMPTVPVITEDPEKVEDIEDLVQEAVEEPADEGSPETAIGVSTADDEEPKEVEDVQPTSEATETVVPVESETPDTVEEPKVEEPKVEKAPNAEEFRVEEEGEAKVEDAKEEPVKVEDIQVHEAKSEIPLEDA